MNGWHVFEYIFEWLWIIAGFALLGVTAFLIVTALHLKTAVMGNAKRLYERPVNSVKSLVATGKGIVQQEQVRVQHMAGAFKGTAGDVKEAATEVKSAAQSIHPEELKIALSNVQHVFRFLSAVSQLTRATAKQGTPHVET